MSELFLTVLNMSFTASYVILFVILIRLLLKKAPKIITYALWGVVAFRLIIPFSFESMFSLLPRNTNTVPIPHDIIYQQSPQINSGIEVVDSFVSDLLPAPTIEASVNPLHIYVEIGSYIWILGIIALLVYSLVSIVILKRQLKSVQLIEQNIFQAKNLKTPFVFGLIRPKIYLPVGLNVDERNYILLHEKTHIQRKDHIIKVLAFLIVSIHWFNPLVWIAFMLMSTDMELSCDERVLKEINEEIKKPYANSLLSLAAGRHILNGSPLAFGEGNVKGRIKNVLNYKKPRFWVIFIGFIIIIAASVGLLSNPQGVDNEYKIDKAKVVQITQRTYPGEEVVKLDNSIWNELVNEINKSKWSELTEEDWPDEEEIVSKITITMQRDESINNKEYIVWIYRNKDKNFLGQEHEFALALTYDNLSDNIYSWRLPQSLYYKLRNFLADDVAAADINLNTDDIAKFVEDNLWEFISRSDVNWDGREESIYLDKSQIKEGLITLRIIDVSGVELWSEQLSTSHAGWGQLFLCEMDDRQYLLRYNPTMYQGYCTYVYTLFTLKDGKENVFRTNKLEFDINGTKKLDVTKMIEFADEVNALLGKSDLLISSTDGDFNFGLYSAEPFFERFSWLDVDEYKKLFEDGDSIESKLNKFSEYAISNRKLMEHRE
ncbi:MAG: M56 family metallopeptidase [Bacillota bacterium]|jgi:beta-lactamase regulating signal transducer with metallopeptidase domain